MANLSKVLDINDAWKNQLIIALDINNEYDEYQVEYFLSNDCYNIYCNVYYKLDGPSIIFSDGSKRYYPGNRLCSPKHLAFINCKGAKEWWVNGKLV